jgi:hypothetical protein
MAVRQEQHKAAWHLTKAFAKHFREFGLSAIERTWLRSPTDYLKIATSLLPRQVDVSSDGVRITINIAADDKDL